MANLRRGEHEVLEQIYKSNCYCNAKSVRDIINKVDATDGNTASIEGQGLILRS